MKKLLLSLCLLSSYFVAVADEGMWLPMLIGKNYEDMKRLGLKLSKDDLYSINHSSMKDAIVQFNGGCTAELISGSGLLLTNHHCGYSSIAALSTVEKNYLDNGFWAYSKDQELPAKGLYVIFLQYVQDVTDQVEAAAAKVKDKKKDQAIDNAIEAIEKKAADEGKFVATVKPFFNSNQYLLLVYKKYTDVRLVGTPPKSLGKFGGDTDNWMWPRHTADFSMFRIYANKENEPADYDKDNIPYEPAHFLPVSTKGEKPGDFAMIFGYPGRTNRYEVSNSVALSISDVNPSIVKIREKRLAIMKKHMDADKSVYLKLTSAYSGIANYWKYFIGQTEQLKRLKVVDKKKEQEAEFQLWAIKKAPEFKTILNEYNVIYNGFKPYAKHNVYYFEGFRAAGLTKVASATVKLYDVLDVKEPNEDSVKKYVDILKTVRAAALHDYDKATDKDVFAAMTKLYYNNVPHSQLPRIYANEIFRKFGANNDSTYQEYADYVYGKTFLLDDEQFNAFCKAPDAATIKKDPVCRYAYSFVKNFETFYEPKVQEFADKKQDIAKRYMQGLMMKNKGKLFYPDANSTMRITYGTVKGYSPEDGVEYKYFTTLEGLMDKYKPGDDEFDVPKKLIDLYKKKDYGTYIDKDSSLHTCFITNNDITGGNSGSPVINANGELIGAAFDGNWEAMSGDIAFDKQYKRTIVCDVRFILFLIDKYGGAKNLIEEMELHN